jgi:hypothetical protein
MKFGDGGMMLEVLQGRGSSSMFVSLCTWLTKETRKEHSSKMFKVNVACMHLMMKIRSISEEKDGNTYSLASDSCWRSSRPGKFRLARVSNLAVVLH